VLHHRFQMFSFIFLWSIVAVSACGLAVNYPITAASPVPLNVGALAATYQASTPAAIEELTIERASTGPIVNGLFGRFAPLSTNCLGNVLCPAGSVSQLACCNDSSRTVVIVCHMNCNSAICDTNVKPTCCGAPCADIYPPECVGCVRTGSCH